MPSPQEVGIRWVHPRTEQVRYYVDDFRDILGIDAPKNVKVWLDRFGKCHVPYCDDEELVTRIARRMDEYMRGDKNVVGRNTANCPRMFTVMNSTRNIMSYDNIMSALNRVKTLKEKDGLHVVKVKRVVERGNEIYAIQMEKTHMEDYLMTPGYQRLDEYCDFFDIGEDIWMIYHGELVKGKYKG